MMPLPQTQASCLQPVSTATPAVDQAGCGVSCCVPTTALASMKVRTCSRRSQGSSLPNEPRMAVERFMEASFSLLSSARLLAPFTGVNTHHGQRSDGKSGPGRTDRPLVLSTTAS